MSKNKQVTCFNIDLPVLRTYVAVIIAPRDQWVPVGKRYLHLSPDSVKIVQEVVDDEVPTDAFYVAGEGSAAIFLKPKFSATSLIHEAVHVGINLLKERGFKDTNTEAEAYLISYICSEIIAKTKRKVS